MYPKYFIIPLPCTCLFHAYHILTLGNLTEAVLMLMTSNIYHIVTVCMCGDKGFKCII